MTENEIVASYNIPTMTANGEIRMRLPFQQNLFTNCDQDDEGVMVWETFLDRNEEFLFSLKSLAARLWAVKDGYETVDIEWVISLLLAANGLVVDVTTLPVQEIHAWMLEQNNVMDGYLLSGTTD